MAASPFPFQTITHAYQLALGARLVDAFERTPEAQDILRRVLCLGNVPQDLPATMLAWMRDFPALHALREELSRGQSPGGPVPLVAVSLGPLLALASNKEWGSSVAWDALVDTTRKTLGRRPPANSVAAMDYTLRVFQPLIPLLAPERRAVFLDAWLEPSVLWQMHRWADKGIYTDMAHAWVSLGLLAEQTPVSFGAVPPLMRWQAMVKSTLYALMYREQTGIIDVLLDSPLANATKVMACCAGDPDSLDYPSVVTRLTTCLPADEIQRIGLLAWASPVGSEHKSGSLSTYMPREAMTVNTRMAQAFCPSLYGMLSCFVPAIDWAEKHKILAYVDALMNTPAPESLALPTDLELG